MQEFDLPESVTIRELCELALAGTASVRTSCIRRRGGSPGCWRTSSACSTKCKLLGGGDHPGRSTAVFLCCTSPWQASCPPSTWCASQIESTHFYEDPTKPTSVQVHKALRDGSLLLDLLRGDKEA
jgi:hypothetical protein